MKPNGNVESLQNCRTETEMTPVKAALLSVMMLSGILLWGAGIYAADAVGGHAPVDGYGVVQASR